MSERIKINNKTKEKITYLKSTFGLKFKNINVEKVNKSKVAKNLIVRFTYCFKKNEYKNGIGAKT